MGRERASDGGGWRKAFASWKGLFDGVAAAFAAGRPGRVGPGLDECHWDARGDHLGLCSATSSLARFPSSWRKRMKSLTLMRAGMGEMRAYIERERERNMKTAERAQLSLITQPAASRREQPNSSYCLIFPIRFQRRGKFKKKSPADCARGPRVRRSGTRFAH